MAIDLAKLKSQLATARVRETDYALFQMLNQLIDYLRAGNQEITAQISGSGGSGGLTGKSYLTINNDLASLPNSRRLLAGTNIAFDDTVAGVRTVNSTGGQQWGVLSDGDLIEPEVVFAGGEVIMTHIP